MKPLKNSRIKRALLKALREKEVVSGDEIALKLGISRVAVWKHVKELNELGYEIESTPKGYKLLKNAEKPYPWELDFRAYYFVNVDSTMNIAKELGEKGEEWIFIIAERQDKGRGRVGRRWESQKGGLYFSLLLKPKIRLGEVPKLLEPVSRAIVKTLLKYGLNPKTAPNGDIFIGENKIAGILVEAFGELDLVNFVVIGVGINANNEVPEGATSLKKELGREISLLDLTKRIFSNLKEELGDFP